MGDAPIAPVEPMSSSERVDRFGAAGIRDFEPAYGRLGAITEHTQTKLSSY